MKKILISLLLCAGISASWAQTRIFHPTVKFTAETSATEPGGKAHVIFNGDFVLNNYLRIGPGVGVGYEAYEDDIYFDSRGSERYNPNSPSEMVYSIPLFASFKYFIIPNRKCTPYLFANVGYTFCVKDGLRNRYRHFGGDYIEDLGFATGGGVGIDINLKRGSLQIELDGKMQKVEYRNNWNNEYRNSWNEEMHHTFFGISVGYAFGSR